MQIPHHCTLCPRACGADRAAGQHGFCGADNTLRVARAVETGRMWVNIYNQIPEGAPFGGYKQSGIGRETHKMILDHYTQVKNIMINLS